MFRFDNYCEQWAQQFKAIAHDPKMGSKDRAFYRIDSYDKIPELCANLPAQKSPCMAVVTHIECDPDEINTKLWHYTYTAYIIVKQLEGRPGEMSAELNAANAKAEGHDIAMKFLAWLDYDKRKNKNPALAGFEFDRASVFTAPAKYGNWWATEVMITNVQSRITCVNPEDYL